MDPIERAIRSALEKGDTLDPVFRKRVYAAAEVALWRSMAAHPTMTTEARHGRIRRLHRHSAEIEDEFTAATEEFVPPHKPITVSATKPRAEAPKRPPRLDSAGIGERRPVPVKRFVGTAPSEGKRRGRLLIYAIFVALLVMLGWLFWTSGILDHWPKQDGSSASNGSSGNSAPRLGNASDESEGWISVFAPADAATIELTGGMAADLRESGASAYVLLNPPGGEPGKAVASIEVGRGLLESFRGKKIVFDIKARASNADGAQISVACELAGMGECQRTRFRLDNQVGDNLVSVQLNDNAPEASGVLSISPHIEGKAGPVEIHSIRVRVSDEQ